MRDPPRFPSSPLPAFREQGLEPFLCAMTRERVSFIRRKRKDRRLVRMGENGRRERPGVIALRILAALLLVGSLAMLFLPWVSLNVEENGQRLSLSKASEQIRAREGIDLREELLRQLPEQEAALYRGLLNSLEPVLQNKVSPIRAAFCCRGSAKWLQEYSSSLRMRGGTDAETSAFCQRLEKTADDLRRTSWFVLLLLFMLLITGIYAAVSAATGYGFGTLPYLFCATETFLGGLLAYFHGNEWAQGGSQAARLLRSALEHLSRGGSPDTTPFGLSRWAILFGLLALLGILLAISVLKPRQKLSYAETGPLRGSLPSGPDSTGARGTSSAMNGRRQSAAEPSRLWRCGNCGTLMGDGIYCVRCGTRKPEPRRCPFCGALLEKDGMFCTECGMAVPAMKQQAAEQTEDLLIPNDDDL